MHQSCPDLLSVLPGQLVPEGWANRGDEANDQHRPLSPRVPLAQAVLSWREHY